MYYVGVNGKWVRVAHLDALELNSIGFGAVPIPAYDIFIFL
jgi:hypothetical protein